MSHQSIHHRFERLKIPKSVRTSVKEPVRESATIRSKVNDLGVTQPDYQTL